MTAGEIEDRARLAAQQYDPSVYAFSCRREGDGVIVRVLKATSDPKDARWACCRLSGSAVRLARADVVAVSIRLLIEAVDKPAVSGTETA